MTLYTTHCPKCEVLLKKLQMKNLEFDIVEDIQIMKQKGYMSVPVLQVEDKAMTFAQAVKYVNGL